MLRSLLASALLGLLTVTSLPAQAQNTAPANPAPATAPQQAVSPQELKQFAVAVRGMLVIARDTEKQMSQAVEKTGLTPARFNEIYLFKRDPATKLTKPVSVNEQKSFDDALSQLTKIEQDAQKKMNSAVQAQGLDLPRFNQIFAAVRSDPKLRQEVQQLIQTQ